MPAATHNRYWQWIASLIGETYFPQKMYFMRADLKARLPEPGGLSQVEPPGKGADNLNKQTGDP